jgi:hypothetical protein
MLPTTGFGPAVGFRGATGERGATTPAGGLFREFFASEKSSTFDRNSLLKGCARRLFELTRRARKAGVYPYQLPLESRSGLWIEAEGRAASRGTVHLPAARRRSVHLLGRPVSRGGRRYRCVVIPESM